jgi:hypothetical protein
LCKVIFGKPVSDANFCSWIGRLLYIMFSN